MAEKRTQAVLFDFDGTLFFDTQKLNTWVFTQVLETMGLQPATQEMINQTVGMKPREIAQLMTRSDDRTVQDAFTAAETELTVAYIARHVHRSESALKMLNTLKPHAKLAICSNATAIYMEKMMEKLELGSCFDEIWTYHQGISKAQAIPRVMKLLGVQSAVFVGDRAEDVSSAHEAGIPVVGIRNDMFPYEVDGADRIVRDHEEMTKAIEELLKESQRRTGP